MVSKLSEWCRRKGRDLIQLALTYFIFQSEVDERIARIQADKSVKGLLIVTYKDDKDSRGLPQIVKSTFPKDQESLAINYGVKLSSLAGQARNLVRDLDPLNDLTFLRVSCKKYEMMIAPDKDYFLIVVQSPEEENP